MHQIIIIMQSRRKFIYNSGLFSVTSLLLGGLYGCNQSNSTVKAAMEKGFSIDAFGIQLWSVKDFMEKDPKKTLADLASYGYGQIESFQGDKGVFWGMKPKEFQDFLVSNGTKCVSAHCNSQFALDDSLLDEFKKLVDDAASIGIEHLINPYLGFLKTKDDFKRATDGFNKLGEICKASDIRYAYHNHHYSFQDLDGEFPQDIMMTGSDKDLVDFEMDIYWVNVAGQDPVEWLEKYPGRFKLSHIKDRYNQAKVAEIEAKEEANPGFGVNTSCVLGKGRLDFDKILDVAQKQGMKKWIVEQERFDGMTSMEAMEKDSEFMKQYLS